MSDTGGGGVTVSDEVQGPYRRAGPGTKPPGDHPFGTDPPSVRPPASDQPGSQPGGDRPGSDRPAPAGPGPDQSAADQPASDQSAGHPTGDHETGGDEAGAPRTGDDGADGWPYAYPYGLTRDVSPPRHTRQGRRWLVTLLLVLAVAVLAGLRAVHPNAGGGSVTDPAARSGQALAAPVTRITTDEMRGLVQAETTALRTGDRAAFLRPFAPNDTELRRRAGTLFDNLRQLLFARAEFVFDGFRGSPDAGGPGGLTTAADISFVHQLSKVDHAATREGYQWTLRRADPNTPPVVTALDGSPVSAPAAYPQPWDHGALVVVRRPHVLLVADAVRRADADTWADRAERAAVRDVAHWKGPHGEATSFLVCVQGDHQDFQRTLTAMGDEIQAVGFSIAVPADTTLDGGGTPAYVGSRIYLDSSDPTFDDTGELDRVIRHEMAHAMVQVFATVPGTLPLWLVEGYAGWVETDDMRTGRFYYPAIRTLVHSGHFTGRLPTDKEIYNADADTAGRNYNLSMYAIRFIADRYGTDAAQDFTVAAYRDPTRVTDALKTVTGMALPAFEHAWAAYVRANC